MRPGDLILAGNGPERFVALVADEVEGEFLIHLATNETEMATDLDLVLEAGECGTPYALMVHAEVYTTAGPDVAVETLGHVPSHLTTALRWSAATDGDTMAPYIRAIPLQDERDPRRAFRLTELARLKKLT
jgi:hypothetical protein